jgi:hypothetical protein
MDEDAERNATKRFWRSVRPAIMGQFSRQGNALGMPSGKIVFAWLRAGDVLFWLARGKS